MASAAPTADVVVVVVAVVAVDEVAAIPVDELNYKVNIYITSLFFALPQFV